MAKKTISPEDKVRQDIVNLYALIGDRVRTIRQGNSDIVAAHNEIDKLQNELRGLQGVVSVGPKDAK